MVRSEAEELLKGKLPLTLLKEKLLVWEAGPGKESAGLAVSGEVGTRLTGESGVMGGNAFP